MSSECVVIETYFVQHHFKNRYLGLNEFELQVPNPKIANWLSINLLAIIAQKYAKIIILARKLLEQR